MRFDQMMADVMRKIVGGVFPHDTFRELQLPLTTEKPSFGIGITSDVTTSAAAFLGSISLTRARMRTST